MAPGREDEQQEQVEVSSLSSIVLQNVLAGGP